MYLIDFADFEGVLMTLPTVVATGDMLNLDRFAEYELLAGSRPAQFTQHNAPDVVGFSCASM
ncbi:MAG: hypothetical protein AAGF94_03225 [Pseudomonadota bacterium]